MKKIVGTLLAAVLSFSCLAMSACGGSKEDSSNTLWITIQDSQAEGAIHVKLGDAFAKKMKEEKGIDVTVKRSTFNLSDYGKSITTLYATQSLGDVVFTYDTYASLYSKNDMFADLTPYVEKDVDLSLYNSTIIESAKAYKNELSYFPRSFDQVTVFINNQFFKDMGMEDKIPAQKDGSWDWWTWSEMLSLLTELRTAINTKMTSAQASYYYPVDANLAWNAVYDSIIKSFGGYTVDAVNMKSGLDSANTEVYENTLKAISFMKNLIVNEYAHTAEGTFVAGNTAMAFMTRPSVSACKDAEMDISFAPMPKFDQAITGIENGTTYVGYGSGGYALNENSNKKDLAWEFIKFAISEEGQKLIASDGLCIPTIKSQLTTEGEWTKFLPGVDQSAFLYDAHTLTLATYARGVEQETEYNIYSKIKQNMMSALQNKEPANVASTLYSSIKNYIK